MHGAEVWIIEDDKAQGTLLKEELEDAGLRTQWMPTARGVLEKIDPMYPDLIVCDLRLPDIDGLTFLRMILDKLPSAPPGFLIITAFGTIPKAIEALRAGADDFLTKPLDLEHFRLCVERILEKRQLREMVDQMRGVLSAECFHDMYGTSAPMRRLFEQIKQVARARGPVLIQGESGAGKELVARAIHLESERKNGLFLPVNCAGIPEHLLESEFFGHAEGSFTGAVKGRKGLFAEARGGTLFLDEISEMPTALQAKLLRILQDGRMRRLGENREQHVDVRVLAATNRDIEARVRGEQFRQDLFFRLETFVLRVPPLRERGEDIELLAARFLRRFGLGLNKQVKGFSSQALELIAAYPFPGNVRELRNAVERAVTFATGSVIQVEHLPVRIRTHRLAQPSFDYTAAGFPKDGEELPSLAEIEHRYIHHVLDRVDGNKRKAAAILGIGRRTLYRRVDEKSDELNRSDDPDLNT